MAIRQNRNEKQKSSRLYQAPGYPPMNVGDIHKDPNKVLLEMAGVTEERRLKMIKDAVKVAEEGMKAKTIKVFNDKDAGLIYSKPLVDYEQRRKAAELALPLAGLKLKEEAPAPNIQVNVVLPDFTKGSKSKVIPVEKNK